MALITYPLNNIDYTAEDAELFHCTRNSGVYATDSFNISVSGFDNTVTIGKGIAWIKNGEFSGKVAASKSTTNIDMGVSDSAFPRIDVIAIQFDASTNQTAIIKKTGVASSKPVEPTMVRTESVYELFLCKIYRKAGAVSITWGDVTDLRMNQEYCGLMADSVTHIDTTAIEAQISQIIEHTEDSIRSVVLEELEIAKESGDFRGEKGDRGEKGEKGDSTTLAELGIIATAKELNFMTGAVSNIQLQLNGKASRGEIPSLSGYATESYVQQKILEAELGEEIDLSDYATKQQLDSGLADIGKTAREYTDLQTEATVNAAKLYADHIGGATKQYADEVGEDAKRYTDQEIKGLDSVYSMGMVREFDSGDIYVKTYTTNGTLSKIYTVLIVNQTGGAYSFVADYKHFGQGVANRMAYYIGGSNETIWVYRDGNSVIFDLGSGATSNIKRVCGYY